MVGTQANDVHMVCKRGMPLSRVNAQIQELASVVNEEQAGAYDLMSVRESKNTVLKPGALFQLEEEACYQGDQR